ncbi:MAG TPA: hypothetical protein VG186_13925 [Solirubrobacteraceae bacterium]|jgi:hypothetical protein|nr:hypothetical protein [Solirubrobacteraceae bacterium]
MLDVGFDVAPGSPSELAAAATRLGAVADGLDEHAGTVRGTAQSLCPSWRGSAAAAYEQLSEVIRGHFQGAARTSRTASAALRRYSRELDRFQQDGRTAFDQAEHWLEEIEVQTGRLRAAEQAVSAAELDLAGAESSAAAPLGAWHAADVGARVTAAQAALDKARAEAQVASRALEAAHHELACWQARGRSAWEEAQRAADRATGTLAANRITAPLLPGMPPPQSGSGTTVIGGAPPHHSGGANLPSSPHSGVGSGTTVIGGAPSHAGSGSGSGSGSGERKPGRPAHPGVGSGETVIGG